MKTIIRHGIVFVAITACLTLAACLHYPPGQNAVLASSSSISSQNEEKANQSHGTADEAISDAQYCNIFSSTVYNSVEDLYQGLRDYDMSNLEDVRFIEDQYLEGTRSKTRVTKDELRDGIFGNLRNQLLREERLMVPYYQNKEMPYDNLEGAHSITLFESLACRKPWILYRGEIGDNYLFLQTMYYDRTLLDEANEKGASWLLSEIDPEGTNIYNYEKWYPAGSNVTVYEKSIQLGDRDVLSLIIDHSLDLERPSLVIYFVYDDILVCAWRGTPEFMLEALKDVTFREVSLPDNKPLRDAPGRENTSYQESLAADREAKEDGENNQGERHDPSPTDVLKAKDRVRAITWTARNRIW